MSAAKQPMVGQTYQARDEQYEPGRQIRILAVVVNSEKASVVTTANPTRPKSVGKVAVLAWKTIATRWRLVSGDEIVAVAPDVIERALDRVLPDEIEGVAR